MTANWSQGNAAEDGSATRGWLVGHFIDPSEGVRSSKDVEVKWFNHPAGDKRLEWTSDDQRTTLVLLVQGNFRVDLTGGSARVIRWKAERGPLEQAEFIDDIPFPETQIYVKKILGTAVDYKRLYADVLAE